MATHHVRHAGKQRLALRKHPQIEDDRRKQQVRHRGRLVEREFAIAERGHAPEGIEGDDLRAVRGDRLVRVGNAFFASAMRTVRT